ncbi:hypothetical protein ACYATP_07850 [Lactobacillaceae bacterium Melli_B4]
MFIISEADAKHHAQLIEQRFQPWFKRMPNTRYRLIVVNDQYDHCYNFYLEIKRHQALTRLVPLHEVDDYDVRSLALVLSVLNRNNHLPIEFRQFSATDQKLLNRSFK